MADYSPPPPHYQLAQTEMRLSGAQKVDVTQYIPPSAISAQIRVTISPPSGAILIYVPDKSDAPIRFNGPVTTGEIPIAGRFIYVQPVSGTIEWKIESIGWKEQ